MSIFEPYQESPDDQPPTMRPGECETCGQWDGGLLNGMCEWCREQYGILDEGDA